MSNLTWSNDYSVFISSIDNEHKFLIEILNEIDHSMEAHEQIRSLAVSRSLNNLSDHILKHFESEERYLLFNNYPDYGPHQEEHHKLLKKLDEFRCYLKKNQLMIDEGMLLFLKDWLVRHIILHDCKYGRYFLAQGDIPRYR